MLSQEQIMACNVIIQYNLYTDNLTLRVFCIESLNIPILPNANLSKFVFVNNQSNFQYLDKPKDNTFYLIYSFFVSILILVNQQYQIKFVIIAVSMQELIKDPDSINFLLKRQISLPLLKHQIDRRILKITAIIERKKVNRNIHQHPSVSHQFVQTEGTSDFTFFSTFQPQQQGVLCPSKKIQLNQIQNNCPTLKPIQISKRQQNLVRTDQKHFLLSRPQRNHRIKSYFHQNQNSLPLLQSNGFTFRGTQVDSTSTNRKYIQQSQDDRIFQQIDFASKSFSSTKPPSILAHGKPIHKTTPSIDSLQDHDTTPISIHTDFSTSDIARTELSQRRRLTRKIKCQEKEVIVPQSERRFIFSSDCYERMRLEANEFVGKRRKELTDNKLRSNVLNKIEERYGETYQN